MNPTVPLPGTSIVLGPLDPSGFFNGGGAGGLGASNGAAGSAGTTDILGTTVYVFVSADAPPITDPDPGVIRSCKP